MNDPAGHGAEARTPPGAVGAATRARILTAAEQVIRERGLGRATTKEIAHAAGCSEAALYKHYRSKSEIVLAIFRESHDGFPGHLAALAALVGEAPVDEVLTEIATRAVPFFRHGIPVGAALFAEPDLLARHRELMARAGTGPRKPLRLLTAYLRAEQDLGRIRPDADPRAAASLLFGACFHEAFLSAFLADDGTRPVAEFARTAVSTLMAGLAP